MKNTVSEVLANLVATELKTEKDGVHQSILNVCYGTYKPVNENEFDYSELIKTSREKYGELAEFAVLIGKYNQQVCNGGHIQYHDNGYDGYDDFDPILHIRLTELFDKFYTDITSDVKGHLKEILNAYEIIKDLEETVEEEYWDSEEQENITFTEINSDYGEVVNIEHLHLLDTKYYEIKGKWMEDIESFFADKLNIS